jgi:hypothetical protein
MVSKRNKNRPGVSACQPAFLLFGHNVSVEEIVAAIHAEGQRQRQAAAASIRRVRVKKQKKEK